MGAVVDVRSDPATSHFESYRYPALKNFLIENNIFYLAMSQELGARPRDRALYTGGKADFKKIAASRDFLTACGRIRNGLEKFPICLLCAQKDPLNCHRSVLITHNFAALYPEIPIFHILNPEETASEQELDARLLKMHGFDQFLLSGKSGPEMLEEAYLRQEKQIAWTP